MIRTITEDLTMGVPLFIGLEESNLHEFESPCCHVGLSIEPLCRIACGQCGQTVTIETAVRMSRPTISSGPLESPSSTAIAIHPAETCGMGRSI